MLQGSFYSHGKLLLTGEYLVLDGALALAVPTKKGQSLTVEELDAPVLEFISLDEHGTTWFTARFDSTILRPAREIQKGPALLETSSLEAAEHLQHMLENIAAQKIVSEAPAKGYRFTSRLEFNRDWGLGSSSTFINNLAQWSDTDPYAILKASLGGSGYDLACAKSDTSIFYKKLNDKAEVTEARFNPEFSDQLYFVHLNQKQNSRQGIQRYKSLGGASPATIARISEISRAITRCQSLNDFETLLREHEAIISQLLDIPPVRNTLFEDYPGLVKSLGAWGGDFVLVTARENPSGYFLEKGYPTIIPYKEMIL